MDEDQKRKMAALIGTVVLMEQTTLSLLIEAGVLRPGQVAKHFNTAIENGRAKGIPEEVLGPLSRLVAEVQANTLNPPSS